MELKRREKTAKKSATNSEFLMVNFSGQVDFYGSPVWRDGYVWMIWHKAG